MVARRTNQVKGASGRINCKWTWLKQSCLCNDVASGNMWRFGEGDFLIKVWKLQALSLYFAIVIPSGCFWITSFNKYTGTWLGTSFWGTCFWVPWATLANSSNPRRESQETWIHGQSVWIAGMEWVHRLVGLNPLACGVWLYLQINSVITELNLGEPVGVSEHCFLDM